jgi:hypothetical protein
VRPEKETVFIEKIQVSTQWFISQARCFALVQIEYPRPLAPVILDT